jgi:hypothetical protein
VAIQAAGCGASGSPKPQTVKVTGKVTYKGQPVSGASVAFLGDGKIPPALGRTDAEGRFELTTSDSGDGAVPGTHQVTVSKNIPAKSTASSATGVASMEDMAKKAAERGGPPPDDAGPMSLLPEKYGSAGTSGLSYEVKSSGTNDFTIELKD